MQKCKVVLADDHAMLLEGLAVLINRQEDMVVVAQATKGAEAIQQILAWQPDLVVLDWSMPDMSGLEVIQRIRAEQLSVPVLVLSRHQSPGYVRQALQAGAQGYIVKQSVTTELLLAIRTILQGTNYLDPLIVSQMVQEISDSGSVQEAKNQVLSEREADVVRLIAHGYSNKEIAARLELSVKTVDTYKVRAMDKLGLYGRVALVNYALQQGWLDEAH